MKYRLVKETTADGRVRFITEVMHSGTGNWCYVSNSLSYDPKEAEVFFNACVANKDGERKEVIRESE